MHRLVIDLADDRPIFSLPDRVVGSIRAALPAGWETVVVSAPARGTGDGGGEASSSALEAVRGAEVYLGFGVPAGLLRAGGELKWVHSGAAGVGTALTPEMLERDILFTNSAGIHGPPVAETVLAYLLHFARGLDQALVAQRTGSWETGLGGEDSPVRELGHSTVGVVGVGGIGREVARRALALGARVVGTRRRRAPVAGVDGIELLTGPGSLRQLLETSDYVVLTLPETPGTRGLIGADEIAAMRPGAVLVNVARGGLIDEDALLAALSARRLRGAALDVFSAEPLPADHPVRQAPNLLITPHTSAYSRHFWEREEALILENIRRYVDGAPLLNVVDKDAGY